MKWDKGKGTECYFNGKQKGTIVEYLRKSRVLANGHDPGRFCWTCCKKIIFFFLEMKLSQALCYVCFYGEKKKNTPTARLGRVERGKGKAKAERHNTVGLVRAKSFSFALEFAW